MSLMTTVLQQITVDNNFSEAQVRALHAIFNEVSAVEQELADLTLSDLNDVDTDGATDGQQLTYEAAGDSWGPGDPNPA